MKILSALSCILCLMMWACTASQPNPIDTEWNTPFGTPPFDQIKLKHYKPALKKGMALQKKAIEAIVNHAEEPSFENTLEALEYSDLPLSRVEYVFENMNDALTSDALQALSKEMAPVLSAHRDDILLNAALFDRIQKVWDKKGELNLSSEQLKLLDEWYKAFVRNGANLNEEDKTVLRKINEELSLLSVRFSENVLKETNAFELVIDNEADLAGLPGASISAAAEAAEERGHHDKWVFTIQKPSLIPFLQFSERRDLREKMFKAYIMKGDHGDELDNKDILSRIAALRVKKARLLGYDTHARFVLEENMAKEPGNVYKLLNQLWKPALKRAKAEAEDLQAMIDEEGNNFELEPWDWWYYAEKVKKAKYDLDEEMLRPYFQLEHVRQGAFDVANRLWGLQFVKREDIPLYHPDVVTFEVKDADGSHVGILYTDYFPRASKRGGAWMSNYRGQYIKDGEDIRPVIVNVGNFTKPTAEKPALLSLEEVETLFHEFGHALHGLLSQCTYPSLSGTNVPRDFVEFPSQVMENWGLEPEIMKSYARHYETGEPIPDDLVEKIRNAKLFNQGFETVEYLAAAFLDMDWHTLTEPEEQDVIAFEEASLNKIGLIPEIIVRYRSPYFNHIFSWGYSAGYYSYIWSEVLDADAFQAFKNTGDLFDPTLASALRKHVYEAGHTEDPMVLYQKFRGEPPAIDALLENRGLN
ncbi:M3 family metallopeptidase [bacterium]|nr:M3 family metallopeptidase [bacterium]